MRFLWIVGIILLFSFFTPFVEWIQSFVDRYQDVPVQEVYRNMSAKLPADMHTEITDAMDVGTKKIAQTSWGSFTNWTAWMG